MDLSAVQHVDLPTRDVLVIFDNSGDREFIGFGSAAGHEFADCFISADKLPEATIRVHTPPLYVKEEDAGTTTTSTQMNCTPCEHHLQ